MKSDRTMSLGRNEIECLTDTLQAQQELLQKLYTELDVERESSSIAADEALSMILRLQGEKAAVGMEASQYKRIAEEKICHSQEMLEMFQELIYQKEMQISYLEFQVQAYKFKLASVGCNELGSPTQNTDNTLLSSKSGLRRGTSLPPMILDALCRRVSIEGEKSTHSSPNSYLEDIKKLDERVKVLAIINGNVDCHKAESADPEKAKVQDIFEVPQCSEQHNANEKNDSSEKDRKEVKIGKKQLLLKYPTYGVADFEVHLLNRRLKQLEDERFVPRILENSEETEGDELRLLREIREKVDTMEDQITSLRTTKPLQKDDQSVGCVKEAIFCFWPWSKA